MRVLVGCEYSATVRDAFRKRGHDAWSCDLRPTEGDPRWHIHGDLFTAINDHGPWDLGIFHPPCTYLTWAGAANWNDEGRSEKREQALEFFKAIYNSDIPRLAIENPRGYPSKVWMRHHQEVNPFDFGEPVRKRICLWLKGLPPLFSTNMVEVKPDKIYIRKTGPRAGQPYRTYFHQGKSAKERARFFPSVANAMADQWGSNA